MTDVADNAFLADCSSGTINFCSVGIVMVTERPFVMLLIDWSLKKDKLLTNKEAILRTVFECIHCALKPASKAGWDLEQ